MVNKLNFRKLIASKFVRDVSTLASGTVAGQVIMFLAIPLLTRIYSPDAFGVLGVYMSLVMMLSVAACLRLELAMPLPESDTDAFNLVVLAVCAASGLSLIVGVIVGLIPEVVVGWLGQPELKSMLWMIPLGVWLAAVYSAIQWWSIRKGRFAALARTQLTRAVGGAGAQASLGWMNPAPFGLLFGHMLYSGLGTVGLLRLLWLNDRQLFPKICAGSLYRNLVKHKRFPLFSVPESLLDTAANSLPVVMIAAGIGPEEAGFMLLAQRVTSIPVGLIGGSISRVYLAEAPRKQRSKELGRFTREIMKTLLKIGIGPFILLSILAPLVFPFAFGAEWARAGTMVSWMVPYMLLQFIASPVSTILHATGNQLAAMGLQLFGFALLIGSIWFAISIHFRHVFEVFAVASMIYYLLYVVVILQLSADGRGR